VQGGHEGGRGQGGTHTLQPPPPPPRGGGGDKKRPRKKNTATHTQNPIHTTKSDRERTSRNEGEPGILNLLREHLLRRRHQNNKKKLQPRQRQGTTRARGKGNREATARVFKIPTDHGTIETDNTRGDNRESLMFENPRPCDLAAAEVRDPLEK